MSIELFFPGPRSRWSLQVGPLACELDGFAAWLATQGYARQTGEARLRLVRHLSLWLGREGLGVEALDEERFERFLRTRGPRAVDLRQTRHQAHALAVPNPRGNRRGDPVAARRLQALAHRKQARRGRRDHKEGRALRTETVINDTLSAGQATTIRCGQTAEKPR